MKLSRTQFVVALALALSSWSPLAGQKRVANVGEQQYNPFFLRPSGGPVVPFFEGWHDNPDGTYELVFGYWNINTEEVLDIPLGPDNFIEPSEFDGMQPTHFLPPPEGDRRHWSVFTVTVPADFGTRDVVWTLRSEGEAYSVPGRLTSSHYALEGWDQPARLNVAPVLRFGAEGPEVRGFSGILSGPISVRAGSAVPVTVSTAHENPYREDARPIILRWMQHQGPGVVTFREPTIELGTEGGEVTNEVRFSAPGKYQLRILAYSTINDFQFFCCWTNGFLEFDVMP